MEDRLSSCVDGKICTLLKLTRMLTVFNFYTCAQHFVGTGKGWDGPMPDGVR